MIHRATRRLSLAAALLCLPAWLTACAPDEVSTTAASSSPTRTATRTPSPSPTPTPTPTPTTADPATSSSDCDLLTPADLEENFHQSGWELIMRTAQPHETGWRFRCVYSGPDSGAPGVTVGLDTGRPTDWVSKAHGPTEDSDGKPLMLAKPTRVPGGIGDEAWSSFLYAKVRGRDKYVPRASITAVRRGSTQIMVSMDVVAGANPIDLATAPEKLGEAAIDRVSEPVEVKAETATGGCGELSLAAASKFTRMRLVSSRSVQPTRGQLNCLLGGREGSLWITVNDKPATVKSWRDNADKGEPISGLGDLAFQIQTTTAIVVDDRVITVAVAPDAPEKWFEESGWTPKHTKASLAFLTSVVSSFS